MFTVIAVTAPLAEQIMTTRARNTTPCSREEIEALVQNMGADLFGVTSLDRLDKFDAVKRIRQLYPKIRTALVIGMHYPDDYLIGGADAAMGALERIPLRNTKPTASWAGLRFRFVPGWRTRATSGCQPWTCARQDRRCSTFAAHRQQTLRWIAA